MIRRRETLFNIIFSVIFQIITVFCGLIVPRLIIETYGSEVNGTISTITQFLAYITLLESGIGGVAKASLYKPLSQKNHDELNSKIKSISIFFKKIGLFYLPYVAILCCTIPFIIKTSFSIDFIVSLIIILSIATFSNYFFGLPSRLLLQADNKSYVVSLVDIVALLVNTALTYFLIRVNSSILIVKLFSSFVFFVKPVVLFLFVKLKYKIKSRKDIKAEKLENRWDGFAQHLAFFIHNNTDIVIISIFLNVGLSSVYSVYSMVTTSIVSILVAIITSFNATFGFMYSKGDYKALKKEFEFVTNLSTFLTISLYSICMFLLIPFIRMYTSGIQDVEYVNIPFGIIFVLAEAIYCLRTPFSSVSLSAGKYKETRRGAIIEMLINIVLSLLLVKPLGLVGIMIGTLTAMIYRTIDFALFCHKNLVQYSFSRGFERIILNLLGCFIGYALCLGLKLNFNGELLNWIFNAIISTILIFGCDFVFLIVVDREYRETLFSFLCNLKERRQVK